MYSNFLSVSIELQNTLIHSILNEQGETEKLKLISFKDECFRGYVTLGKCDQDSSQVSNLKRPSSKVSQNVKPRVTPKQFKPLPSAVPGPSNNTAVKGDYAVLSAASSKVDTSTLISVVQNLKTNEKEFRCSFCQYFSKTQANTKRHIDLNHVNSGVVLQCKTCGKTSKLKANLKAHYIKAHNMSAEAANSML